MSQITTIGLDLAKQVLHVVCCDERGKLVNKRMLKRRQVLTFFAALPPARIGMEACAGAHYWTRALEAQGHQVILIPAQYVKAYVRGNKNDYNDALAISEAMACPQMRHVAVKTPEQQELQALHRLRERCVQMRTGLCNQIRGLVAEYGLVCPKGVAVLRRQIPAWLEDGENGLSAFFRRLLAQSYAQLQSLDAHITFYTQELERQGEQNPVCQRLQTIPGFGPIAASVFYSQIGHAQAYRRGRDVAAALGLVPRQHSSGAKQTLLGISKRGDRYLRSVLVHGARAVVARAAKKQDRLSQWINRIRAERGFNKAAVALANKMARIGWAVVTHNTVYRAA
jgi:transposase